MKKFKLYVNHEFVKEADNTDELHKLRQEIQATDKKKAWAFDIKEETEDE